MCQEQPSIGRGVVSELYPLFRRKNRARPRSAWHCFGDFQKRQRAHDGLAVTTCKQCANGAGVREPPTTASATGSQAGERICTPPINVGRRAGKLFSTINVKATPNGTSNHGSWPL